MFFFGAVDFSILFIYHLYFLLTRNLIASERDRVVARLQAMPAYKVYLPEANFVLLRILDASISASELFETAIRQGLMIRDCSDFLLLGSAYFRFCFMMPEDNDRLLDVLSSFHPTK